MGRMLCTGMSQGNRQQVLLGFAVWYGDRDPRNDEKPVPGEEKQSITRAELHAVILALDKKKPGVLPPCHAGLLGGMLFLWCTKFST